MRGEEVARAGAELIDEKGAAGTQHAVRRGGDRWPDTRRQGRERQARQDIVGPLEPVRRDDRLDIRRTPADRAEAAVAAILFQIADDIRKDERPFGKEGVGPVRIRWYPVH